MSVSVTKFLIDFPEFKRVDRLLVSRKLKEAERTTFESVWGDNYALGLMLQAAHLISISPLGQQARLIEGEESGTTYEEQRKTLARTLSSPYAI